MTVLPRLSQADSIRHIELSSRYNEALAIKSGYEVAMNEIIDYGAPTIARIDTKRPEGAILTNPVFDSTLVRARELLVNFVVGNVAPSSEMGWAGIDPPIDKKNNRRLKIALNITAERLLEFLAMSNFYEQMACHVDSMFSIGNAVMGVQEDSSLVSFRRRFGKLVYDTVPLSQMVWKAESGNRIYFMCRSQEMTLSEIHRKFKDPGMIVDYKLRQGTRPTDKLEVRHYVYRNETNNPSMFALKGPPGSERFPWVEEYVICDSQEETIIHRGIDLSPYVISRLIVVGEDSMGRGLGHISRAPTKAANFIGRLTWLGIDKDIRRPLIVWDRSHLSASRAGARVVVKPGYDKPEFMDPGVDILRSNEIRQQEQQEILQIWGADAFLDPESQPRSAEESIQRRQRNLQRHARHSQRFAGEFLDPILNLTISILLKAGELPELESQIDEIGDAEMTFRYTSPFFRAQMQSQLESAYALLERRAALTKETGQEGWFDDLDLDFIREMERTIGGVPELAFKSQEAIDLVREARGERMAQERELAILEASARAGRPRAQLPIQGGVPLG